MGERPDDSIGDGEKPGPSASGHHLPVVWSPKIGAGEGAGPTIDAAADMPDFDADEMDSKSDDIASEEAPSAAAPARGSRFALLATAVALAAVCGSFAGALTASGVGRFMPASKEIPASADARDVLRAINGKLAELSSIRADLDNATRGLNGQFAKIADRLDRVERAEVDPAAKLAHIADTIDRLDKQSTVTPETTGSIKPGDAQASDPKLTDRILEGWVVQEVQGGRALVESRYGGIFDVGAGSVLPGIGRVDAVKRQDGQWIVVTARGIITSGR